MRRRRFTRQVYRAKSVCLSRNQPFPRRWPCRDGRVYAGGVESSDITTEQAAILRERFGEMLNYAGRVKRRKERLGFPHNDPVYRETSRAADAIHPLVGDRPLTCERTRELVHCANVCWARIANQVKENVSSRLLNGMI
jgi:hypothetical protein